MRVHSSMKRPRATSRRSNWPHKACTSGALTMTGLSRWRLDEKPEYERVLGSNSCDLTISREPPLRRWVANECRNVCTVIGPTMPLTETTRFSSRCNRCSKRWCRQITLLRGSVDVVRAGKTRRNRSSASDMKASEYARRQDLLQRLAQPQACFAQDPQYSTGARGTRPKLLDIQRPDLSPIMTHPTVLPSIRGHAFMGWQ